MQQQTALVFLLVIYLSGADEYGTTTSTTSSYPPEGCPPGWVNSLEGCFLFHFTKNITWRDAQEECERVGGFLAEIKSEEQAMLLVRRGYYNCQAITLSFLPRLAWHLYKKAL
jgi:hypothetical protein